MGNGELIDSLINDGLWCAFDALHMGAGTEQYTQSFGGITREVQDELAARSHDRAAAAMKEGRLADEIVPVPVPQRKGDPVMVLEDEGVRPETTVESLSKLRPAFAKDGTITAGNASQISDGAAALIVTSREKAEELGATPIAELVGFGMVAGPDTSLLTQPSRAIKRALDQANLPLPEVDLFELNEAFAAVGIASMQDLGIGDDVVNVNGGAIALGSPRRYVGCAHRRVDHPRAAPPRWWPRRRRPLRWWRPGRRRSDPRLLIARRPGRAWCQGDAALIRAFESRVPAVSCRCSRSAGSRWARTSGRPSPSRRRRMHRTSSPPSTAIPARTSDRSR